MKKRMIVECKMNFHGITTEYAFYIKFVNYCIKYVIKSKSVNGELSLIHRKTISIASVLYNWKNMNLLVIIGKYPVSIWARTPLYIA